ncbi:hypothetical protein MMC30_001118 [Trapelia coarctata]|nr:hypothetical protein [Trapelia coarctata]
MSPRRPPHKSSALPKPPAKALLVSAHDDEDMQDQDSQDSATEMITHLAQRMVSSTRKRREDRRNELKSELQKKSASIEKRIETAFGDQIKQVQPRSKAMKERLEYLGILLERKAAIEENLFAHTSALEKAYIDANKELSVTMKGRMNDIVTMGETKVSLRLLLQRPG